MSPTFFSGPRSLVGPRSCQAHAWLVESALLRGVLIKLSRTVKEILSHIILAVQRISILIPPDFVVGGMKA